MERPHQASSSMVSEIRNNYLKRVTFQEVSTLYNISIDRDPWEVFNDEVFVTVVQVTIISEEEIALRDNPFQRKRKELKEELKLNHQKRKLKRALKRKRTVEEQE